MVKINSQGRFPVVDLTIVNDLIAAAIAEWDSLAFRNRLVVNPRTDAAAELLQLTAGEHRVAGSTYRAAIEVPILELPPDRVEEFERRANDLTRSTEQAVHDRYHADRSAAMVMAGTRTEVVDINLVADTDTQLALAFTYANAGSGQLELDRGSPRAAFSTAIDLSAIATSQGQGALMRWLLGGRADLNGRMSLDPLLRPVPDVVGSVSGTVNRFAISGAAKATTIGSDWDITIDAELKGKGLGKVATGLAGRKIRKEIEKQLAVFWRQASIHSVQLGGELAELRAEVDRVGGPQDFIRQLLYS